MKHRSKPQSTQLRPKVQEALTDRRSIYLRRKAKEHVQPFLAEYRPALIMTTNMPIEQTRSPIGLRLISFSLVSPEMGFTRHLLAGKSMWRKPCWPNPAKAKYLLSDLRTQQKPNRKPARGDAAWSTEGERIAGQHPWLHADAASGVFARRGANQPCSMPAARKPRPAACPRHLTPALKTAAASRNLRALPSHRE